MAHLYRVIVPVSDIEAAAVFYGAILNQPGKRVSPGRHYFECGGTILACFDPKADGECGTSPPNPQHVYLSEADLQAAYERCQAADANFDDEQLHGGGPSLGEIAIRPWGERSFYLHDPFGNPVCFVDEKTVFTG
ncbi:MAG: VOC family protein [Gammaproteobacteria bacterium]|nr:VOC family protein [Gammaproteobacteria bacterium]